MTDETSADQSYSHEVVTDPELLTALLESQSPFTVDWEQSALEMDEQSRLLRLARIKALLPSNNALDEKTTHDATLENYIRLALQAAGTKETLNTFLFHVQNAIESGEEGAAMLAQQVFWIWAPAAEVAGLYNHKTDLEEAAFKVLYPEEYERICSDYDKATLEGSTGLLGIVGAKITRQLDDALDKGVTYEISSRPKSNYSVWRKLKSEDRQSAQLFDLLGYRIILDGDDELATEQCYVAIAAIAAEFSSDTARFKDYISNPKATGYQSVHLTLYTAAGFPFEVQVRTRAMHNYAESDNALSHQTYEATYKEIPGKIQKTYKKIPRLYRWRNEATRFIRDNQGQTEGFMEGETLFFRDDGNLYRTQNGSTALDASFRIHSRRALRTKRIYLDGRVVSYKHTVPHGGLVRVEYDHSYPTDPSKITPLNDSVVTPYAKQAIEHGKRSVMREQLIENGSRVIALMGAEIGLEDPLSVLDAADRRALADKMGLPSFNDLLAVIGTGKNNGKPTRVANWIKERCGLGEVAAFKLSSERTVALENSAVLAQVVIPGIEHASECLIAGCCSEKIHQGDPVLVRPSRIEGTLKLHLQSCNNIRDFAGTIACSWNT